MQEERLMEMERQRMYEKDDGFGQKDFRVKDSMNDQYAPLAQLAVPVDRVPEDIQRRMIKVLSKHRPQEVREWS